MITLYGISNCDTVRKARKWLERRAVNSAFHDYKKAGITEETLRAWSGEVGWDVLLNKRGTTFRKLGEADKADITRDKAIVLMVQHPSLIKRPVLEYDAGLLVGFKEDVWKDELC